MYDENEDGNLGIMCLVFVIFYAIVHLASEFFLG